MRESLKQPFIIHQDSFWKLYTIRFPRVETSCDVALHVKNKFQMNLCSSFMADRKKKLNSPSCHRSRLLALQLIPYKIREVR